MSTKSKYVARKFHKFISCNNRSINACRIPVILVIYSFLLIPFSNSRCTRSIVRRHFAHIDAAIPNAVTVGPGKGRKWNKNHIRSLSPKFYDIPDNSASGDPNWTLPCYSLLPPEYFPHFQTKEDFHTLNIFSVTHSCSQMTTWILRTNATRYSGRYIVELATAGRSILNTKVESKPPPKRKHSHTFPPSFVPSGYPPEYKYLRASGTSLDPSRSSERASRSSSPSCPSTASSFGSIRGSASTLNYSNLKNSRPRNCLLYPIKTNK